MIIGVSHSRRKALDRKQIHKLHEAGGETFQKQKKNHIPAGPDLQSRVDSIPSLIDI